MRGLTLVEVVASLALLGSMLAGLLVAHGELTRRWADAGDRLEALRVADNIMNQWWLATSTPPPPPPESSLGRAAEAGVDGTDAGLPNVRTDQGTLTAESGRTWRWQIMHHDVEGLDDLGVQGARLVVMDDAGQAMADMEFLVAADDRAPETGAASP